MSNVRGLWHGKDYKVQTNCRKKKLNLQQMEEMSKKCAFIVEM